MGKKLTDVLGMAPGTSKPAPAAKKAPREPKAPAAPRPKKEPDTKVQERIDSLASLIGEEDHRLGEMAAELHKRADDITDRNDKISTAFNKLSARVDTVEKATGTIPVDLAVSIGKVMFELEHLIGWNAIKTRPQAATARAAIDELKAILAKYS